MITDHLDASIELINRTRSHLLLVLKDSDALTALLIMPLLEQSARLLADLDALQSAVKSDSEAK